MTSQEGLDLNGVVPGGWALNGVVTLGCFVVVVVVYLVGYGVVRRTPPGARGRGPAVLDRVRRPHEVACLAAGPDLAVAEALSSLTLRRLVRVADGVATARDEPQAGADELEEAVAAAVETPVAPAELPDRPGVRAAVDVIENRLVADGLLITPEARTALLRVVWVSMVVFALGALWWLASVMTDGSGGLLFLVLLNSAPVVVTMSGGVPRRTGRGDRALAAAGVRYCPQSSPRSSVRGPRVAVTEVGLDEDFGLEAPRGDAASGAQARLRTSQRVSVGFVTTFVMIVVICLIAGLATRVDVWLVSATIIALLFGASLHQGCLHHQATRDELLLLQARDRPPVLDGRRLRDGLPRILAEGRRRAAHLHAVHAALRAGVAVLLVVADLVYVENRQEPALDLGVLTALALASAACLVGSLNHGSGVRHRARAMMRAVEALEVESTAADLGVGEYGGTSPDERLRLFAGRAAALARTYPGYELDRAAAAAP